MLHIVQHVRQAVRRLRKSDHPAPATTWFLRFVQAALFIPLLLVTYRAVVQRTTFPEVPVYASAPQQRVLVVHSSMDFYGDVAYANAIRALDYARLNHDDLDLAGADAWPELGDYSALLFITELLNEIDEAQAQRISDYVAGGGGLAAVYRGWNPHLAPIFGIKVGTEYPELVAEEGGLDFQADFFPGVKGLVLSEKTVPDLSAYAVRLQPDVRVLASSGKGRPIVWLSRHGQGRALFWNTVFLAEKEARGFIVQSVLSVQGLGILPIANFATLQIDDFPAAVSSEKIEPVASEFDMTMVEFYDQVWFPDMMDIARRYGIVYTFLIPFNYNDVVEPPFGFREWEHADIEVDSQRLFYSVYVSHLAAKGHELGLHGYNHISLALENWPSEEIMAEGLRIAYERWGEDNLGPPTITYVPPNNIYDAAGARALTQGFPSLQILAGIYTGHFEKGGNREFGPEPWNPKLFDIPRVTFGYNLTPRYRFAMVSELGMMGIWTTFIHPDDVVHTPENYPDSPYHRNPNYWPWRGDDTGEKNGFYYRFLRWLDFAQTYYPWLRYTRTDESYYILRLHLQNQVEVDLKAHEVVLHSTVPTYFQVRINDGRRIFLNALQGAQFVHVYHGEGYTLYTLRGIKDEVRLKLLMPAGMEEPFPGPAPAIPQPGPAFGVTEEDDTGPADLQSEDLFEKLQIPVSTPVPTLAAPVSPLPTSAFDVLPTGTPTPGSRP
ncbi:MAG: DUF2194 domain-containing protein [Anaerolineae bacterium]